MLKAYSVTQDQSIFLAQRLQSGHLNHAGLYGAFGGHTLYYLYNYLLIPVTVVRYLRKAGESCIVEEESRPWRDQCMYVLQELAKFPILVNMHSSSTKHTSVLHS